MRTSGNIALGLVFLAISGCGSDSTGADMGNGNMSAGTEQVPPTEAAALRSWLEKGTYKDWHCESAVHAARAPSPHGFNRICSNDAIAQHASETTPWPKGAAAVKELYAEATATTPAGYAVYLKTSDDSADGANFYWYEAMLSGTPVADGMGDSGTPKTVCVGCHAAAGSDAPHTPSLGGRDQVYTPVQ